MRTQIVDTIIEDKEGRVLMLRRNFYPQGKLDFLGGFVDPGEDIESAAIREAKEESGLDVKLIRKIGEFDYFDRGDKTLHVFIAEVVGGRIEESKEGSPEWVDLSGITARDLAFPQVHVDVIRRLLSRSRPLDSR